MKPLAKWVKVVALAGGIIFSASSVVSAAERLTESFTSPEGGIPNGWKAAKATVISVAEVTASPSGGNELLIQRTAEGAGSAAVFYLGGDPGMPPKIMGNLSASVMIRMDQPKSASSCSHGILLRAAKMTYKESEGYFVAVVPSGKEAGLAIYWNPTAHAQPGDRIAFTAIPNLTATDEYILQVKAEGSTIEGQLWSVDGAGAKKDLLGKVQTDQATHATEGYFALRNGLGNSGPIGTWYKALHLSTGE